MISAEFYGIAIDGGDCSAVSGVGAVDGIWGDEDYIGCATCSGFFLVFGSVVFVSLLSLDVDYLFFALFGLHEGVHFHEGLAEGLLVFRGLIIFVDFKFFAEVSFDEDGDFWA